MKKFKTDEQKYLLALGNRITDLREEIQTSQRDFAEKVGVSQMQIYRIENGKISAGVLTLRKIALALGVEMIELFELAK